jgi:hypothetical protein
MLELDYLHGSKKMAVVQDAHGFDGSSRFSKQPVEFKRYKPTYGTFVEYETFLAVKREFEESNQFELKQASDLARELGLDTAELHMCLHFLVGTKQLSLIEYD